MEKKKSEKVRLSLMMSEDVLIRFRIWCVKNKKSFSGGVEYVIEKFLREVEEKEKEGK